MSEVAKLYENSGVEKEWKPLPYGDIEEYYPLFTAEKQLNIIKLLAQQCDLVISHFEKWEFIHFDGQESTQITGKDFTETLALYQLPLARLNRRRKRRNKRDIKWLMIVYILFVVIADIYYLRKEKWLEQKYKEIIKEK